MTCPQGKVEKIMAEMTAAELDDFLVLMRSLSIAYEQHRNSWSSEYVVEFIKKQVPRSEYLCVCVWHMTHYVVPENLDMIAHSHAWHIHTHIHKETFLLHENLNLQ